MRPPLWSGGDQEKGKNLTDGPRVEVEAREETDRTGRRRTYITLQIEGAHTLGDVARLLGDNADLVTNYRTQDTDFPYYD